MTSNLSERSAARLVLLAAMLVVLGSIKLSHSLGTGPFGPDGSFYVNVARNVQEGIGLKTSISMYHTGELELPVHSTLIYPLWPLLLGYTARAIGLFPAVAVLPKVFYFVDLLLFYWFGNRLAARMNRGALTERVFTPGHLLVLLLGLNGFFFGVTVQPYTDGLAIALMLGALIVLDRGAVREGAPSIAYAAAAGVLAGLAQLARTQSIILIIGIFMALVWLVVSNRRLLGFAIAFAITCGALLAVWYFGFYTMPPGTRARIDYDRMWAQPQNTAEWLRHRLEGLVVAVNPFDRYSYFRSLGLAIVLPLIAAPLALRQWLRAKPLRLPPTAMLPLATTLSGIGFFFVLNLFHHRPGFFQPWIFSHRHALPVMLLIAAAAVYLLGLGRKLRIATIGIIAITAALGLSSILAFVTQPRPSSPTPAESALAVWVDEQLRTPVILTARSHHLSVYTRANLHWTLCETPPEKTREMLAKLPIDYVVVYAHEQRCRFVSGLGDVLVERARFGEGPGALHLLARRDRPRG